MSGRSSGGSCRPGVRTGEEVGLVSGRSSGGSCRPGARTGEEAGLVSDRSSGGSCRPGRPGVRTGEVGPVALEGGAGVGYGTVEVGSVALEGGAGVEYGTVEVGSVALEGGAGVGSGVEVGVGVFWVSGTGGMVLESLAVSLVIIRSNSRRM